MKYQRTILLALLVSLGVLLSACGTDAAPSDKLAEDLPEGWVAVENPGGLATAALSDEQLACFWEDADYKVIGICVLDEGLTDIDIVYPLLPEDFNDRISSVELRPGVSAELFKDAEYQGDSLELTANSNYIGDEFNDTVSSIRVTVPAPEGEQ